LHKKTKLSLDKNYSRRIRKTAEDTGAKGSTRTFWGVPPGLSLWAPAVIFCDLLPPPPRMHVGPTLSRFDPMALVHPTGLYIQSLEPLLGALPDQELKSQKP
jgi:hypothetical protein